MDSGDAFHIIAALCLNVFLPYSVLGLCRANFRLSLMVLAVGCIVTMSWISAGSSLSYSAWCVSSSFIHVTDFQLAI